MLCPAPGGVQGKGTGVGEAVQHRPPPGQPRHRQPVVLLVQEEAGFLPVLHVHQIADAVFRDLRHSRVRRCFAGKREPALALGQPFLFPQGDVIA